MSAVFVLAKPQRIKAAHRRRWKCASGHRVYILNNPLAGTDPTGYCEASVGTHICDVAAVGTETNAHAIDNLSSLKVGQKDNGGQPGQGAKPSAQPTASVQNQPVQSFGGFSAKSRNNGEVGDASNEWKEDAWSKAYWDAKDNQSVTTPETDDVNALHDRTINQPLEKGLGVVHQILHGLYVAAKQSIYLLGPVGEERGVATAVEESAAAVRGAEAAKPATTYLYQKVGSAGEHLKYGITKNPLTRYTKDELAGGKLRIIGRGQRSEMLRLERQLHGTLPIGPEEAQKFYIQQQIERGLTPPPYK